MKNALQEQLLKAGLSDEAALKKKGKKRPPKQSKKKIKAAVANESVNAIISQVQAEKKARDQALNQKRLEAQKQRDTQRRVKQIVESNQCNDKRAQKKFHFQHIKKIKQIYITEPQQALLTEGTLVIVAFEGKNYLLPTPAGEKIKALLPRAVISVAEIEESKPEADDPYAEFVVPDDLIW